MARQISTMLSSILHGHTSHTCIGSKEYAERLKARISAIIHVECVPQLRSCGVFGFLSGALVAGMGFLLRASRRLEGW